jgi:hypothetical protein
MTTEEIQGNNKAHTPDTTLSFLDRRSNSLMSKVFVSEDTRMQPA